jgi:hypothetical protein
MEELSQNNHNAPIYDIAALGTPQHGQKINERHTTTD